MGSGFDNSIYLDFHLADVQLLVAESYVAKIKVSIFSAGIVSPGFFLAILCLSEVSQSWLLDESSLLTGRRIPFHWSAIFQ
jgi:hypothetical protein